VAIQEAHFRTRHVDAFRDQRKAVPRKDRTPSGRAFVAPDEAKDAVLENACAGFVCGELESLLLVGPRGTGKTQASLEITALSAQRCAESDGRLLKARYWTLLDLFEAEKETFEAKARDVHTKTPLRATRDFELLVLDECHERFDSTWEDRKLVQLFDWRYGEGLRTILIGNWESQEAAAAALPSSVWSRLQETGVVVTCDWPSFRRRKNQGAQ
jgi:DNA replication protein DnaC